MRGGVVATSPLFVSPGDVVKLDLMLSVNGAANPPGNSGLGVCLEYERGIAGDPLFANVLPTDLAADGAPQALGTTDCRKGGAVDVPGADTTVIKAWLHLGGGGWPNVSLPVKLYDAQFTVAANPVGATRIGFGASGVAAAETFVAPGQIVLCGKPTVTVAKITDGAETASQPVTFNVTLSRAVPSVCSTSGVFPVTLDVGGSATRPGVVNADYAFTGSNVAFSGQTLTLNVPADGATTAATIVATPVDDAFAEGTETVSVQLVTGSGSYVIGAAASASANIVDNDVSTVAINNPSAPNGAVGAAYAQTMTATGGVSPYTFALSGGALPPGLSLVAGGALSGMPTTAGTYDFAVGVTDSTAPGAGGPKTGSKAFRLVVDKGTQTITFAPIADRALYSTPLTVSATTSATLPVSFSVAGNCSLSGTTVTPTAVGTCTVRATQSGDANWNAAANIDRAFNVIAPTVVISPPTLPNALAGVPYTGNTLSGSGALASYGFALTGGALPPGLQLAGNGALTGTPTQTGSYNFTVTATDSSAAGAGGPFSATKAYSIDVTRASSTSTLSSNFNPAVTGQTVVLSATIAGSAVVPTGTVTFVEIATPICTSVALQAGKATCVLANPAVGIHPLSVNYSGDVTYAPSTSPTFFQTVQNPNGRTLQVTKAGAGSGTVTSAPAGIDCGATCSQPYAGDTAVSLSATPSAGSVFVGWLGACGGQGVCNINVTGTSTVSATFLPNTVQVNADVDGNGNYDALTDGVLVIRYMFGLSGSSLIGGAIGSGATRTTAAQIVARVDELRPGFDIDADGRVDALTDGVLLIRYLFGLRGGALTGAAIGPTASRTTAVQIETYLQSLTP